jgi:hypothetical protein
MFEEDEFHAFPKSKVTATPILSCLAAPLLKFSVA